MNYHYQPKEYEERLVQTKAVTKKTSGGSTRRYSTLIVIGNRKGKVGVGTGKAADVPSAIQKATKAAKRNLIDVKTKGSTIPHSVEATFKSASIVMKPAPQGSGIIAGGAIRPVLELAGIKDISAKLVGSSNKAANIQCVLLALQKLKG